eukprot:9179802-Alexandrium_andersonii.AAC.1
MSASLVGSEMCIRDRSKHMPHLEDNAHAQANGTVRPPKAQRASRSGGSVSYTHLTLPTICSV